jgi:hypothetical protein
MGPQYIYLYISAGNGAEIGAGLMRAKIDGSRQRGEATSMMEESATMARALRGEARRSAVDTAFG